MGVNIIIIPSIESVNFSLICVAIAKLKTIFFFSGYPERLDLKPVGARDPPAHFQRKQEYL